MAKIAPSILAADFANLERDIHDLEKNGADWERIYPFTDLDVEKWNGRS